MDQSRAVLGGDEVTGDDAPRLGSGCCALGAAVGRVEVVEDRGVAPSHKLGPAQVFDDLGLLAQLLGVGGEQGLGDDDAFPREFALLWAHDDVVDVGAHGDGEVGGQGPGRGRPDQRQLPRLQAQADGHRLVGAVLVDVVVHLQLVGRQRRLVVPAVGQHAETLVDEALVVEGLEGPDDGLHVGGVQRLVVVVEVDPARLAGHVVLPFAGVLQDTGAGGVVEGADADAPLTLDLGLVGDPQCAFGLEFGGQPVGVPAEATFDVVTEHRLVAPDDVLDVAGEEVAVVGQAVGEGRAVVEDELIVAVAPRGTFLHGPAEGVVGVPVGQGRLFHVGEGGVGLDLGVPVAGVEPVLRHGVLGVVSGAARSRDDARRCREPRYHPAWCAGAHPLR